MSESGGSVTGQSLGEATTTLLSKKLFMGYSSSALG
jgi:hypothetical protein